MNKCTIRTFAKGVKPVSRQWWIDNRKAINKGLFELGVFTLIVVIVSMAICILALVLGIGGNTTNAVAIIALISIAVFVIHSFLKWVAGKIKQCCEMGGWDE